MVSEKMLEEQSVKELMDKLEAANRELYDAVMLKLKTGMEIRRDVLVYFSENAEDIDCGDEYLFHFSALLENRDVSPEWFGCLNDYHKRHNRIGISDLMLVVLGAIDEGVSVEEVSKLLDGDESDVFSVYGKIHHQGGNEAGGGEEPLQGNGTDNEEKDGNEELGFVSRSEVVESGGNEQGLRRGDEAVNVFDNLLKVITTGNVREHNINTIQDGLNGYVNDLQGFVRNLSVFSNEIVREWENDKIMIERLKALYEVERKLLCSQQERIASMQAEIAVLNSKVRSAERSEMRREEINKKLSELQSLAQQEENLLPDSFRENI